MTGLVLGVIASEVFLVTALGLWPSAVRGVADLGVVGISGLVMMGVGLWALLK